MKRIRYLHQICISFWTSKRTQNSCICFFYSKLLYSKQFHTVKHLVKLILSKSCSIKSSPLCKRLSKRGKRLCSWPDCWKQLAAQYHHVTLESSMELQLGSLAQLHVVPWNHGSYAQGLEITHLLNLQC